VPGAGQPILGLQSRLEVVAGDTPFSREVKLTIRKILYRGDAEVSPPKCLPQPTVSTALIVRAFPTCLIAGYWPSRRFRSLVAFLCQASCDLPLFACGSRHPL
jgi:hypothetical protein